MRKWLVYIQVLLTVGMLFTSCHKCLNYGVNWYSWADEVQTINDSMKIELEWFGDTTSMVATVKDKDGQTLAIISRQSMDDICTVIKYLRNDTGGVRGFLVYPNCYPVADRHGNAQEKEGKSSDGLQEYKEMLWNDFYSGSHPCDIGLALALDNREDRPYASRYYFKYDVKSDDNRIKEIYDPVTKQRILAGDALEYEVLTESVTLQGDSVRGDVQLLFTNIGDYDVSSFTYSTYIGYRPLEEMEFSGFSMWKRTIFRSDRPEPFVTVEHEEYNDGKCYVLSCDYDDRKYVSTYKNGVLQKIEEISQFGTVLKQDLFSVSQDRQSYVHTQYRYNYQTKKLEKVGTMQMSEPEFRMTFKEEREMELSTYLHEMWGRYGIDRYWEALEFSRHYEEWE